VNVNVQDLVKRHFWVVGAFTIAICAFFGGRAVAHVIEGKVLGESTKPPKTEPARPAAAAAPVADVRSKGGKPLADRNIFCSDCLPPVEVATTVQPSAGGGPPITQLPLSLIATFVSDKFRMATVLNTSTQAQGGYVLNGEIAGAGPIVAIETKYVDFKNTGAGGRIERISIDAEPPTAEPPPAVATGPVDTGAPKDEMSAMLDAGIKKIDDSNFEIDRSMVDKLLANPLAATKGARVTASIKNGKPNGIKLYAIRPSSVYAKLGLANGDTIHSINGNELDSLDKGLEVYQKVKDASGLEVEVTRRGKPMSIHYTIK
jgi:general secretion pathway protein C